MRFVPTSPTLLACWVVLAACADDRTSPPLSSTAQPVDTSAGAPTIDTGDAPGYIAVSTAWVGAQPDPDGYVFQLDDNAPSPIGPTQTIRVPAPIGTHDVTLSGVAANCELLDGPLREVRVVAGEVTEVLFDVICHATLQDRILYTRVSQTGELEILAMRPDGSDPLDLSVFVPPNTHAYWPSSPSDGRTVVHLRQPVSLEATQLWSMNADSSSPRLHLELAYMQAPMVSPDGSKVAVSVGHPPMGDIYVVDLVVGGAINLTNTPGLHEKYPAWSPDGTQIAYTRDQGDETRIWVMNADGTAPRSLTGLLGNETTPAWSPDGTRIAYAADRARLIDQDPIGDMEIHVVNADGSGDRFLSSNIVDDFLPSWSGDGLQIVYTITRGSFDFDIMVQNADGGEAVALADSADDELTSAGSWGR